MRLLLDLPWWVGLAVLAGLGLYIAYFYLTFERRLDKFCHDAVLEIGKPLEGAEVEVHAAKAVPRPEGPSPYDVQEGDEEFCEGIDGQPWDEEGYHFYSIDATITPADPEVEWDPVALAVVPADYVADDPVEISEDLGGMHSAERYANGRWLPLRHGDRRGPQRLRMLFAIRDGVRAVKFANVVTYFGRVELPAPLPKAGSRF